MDTARVVEVWVPHLGRVGSGYLLSERLVLTAYHVVDGLVPGAAVEVRPLGDSAEGVWSGARVCWPPGPVDLRAVPGLDAALLEIDTAGQIGPLVGTVRFGEITGPDRVPCEGLGFPDAEKRPGNRRDTMPVRGHVDALHGRKSTLLTVQVDVGVVPRRRNGASGRGSGWAGASGTAVFCGPLMVAVLATDRDVADDASVLGAVPVKALADEPGFRDVLAAHSVDLRFEHASPSAFHLAAYLRAAEKLAAQHPRAAVQPGRTQSLASMYRSQNLRPSHPSGTPWQPAAFGRPDPRAGVRPESVLADPPSMCVILSGPGGGKSSLLRFRLACGVREWQADRLRPLLPVLVQAGALAGATFVEALTTAATQELNLTAELPKEFFRLPPRPGARWLVLVDGLDEIHDPAARAKVLSRLAAAARDPEAPTYRFVIACRPLPDDELDILGQDVPRHELLPFDTDDIEGFARAWFHTAGVTDPVGAARKFRDELWDRRLTGLAQVPLMTAMLCRTHARNPGRPLAGNRGAVYRDFIAHLRSESATQAHGGVGPDRASGSIEYLIGYLASERHRGNTRSAVAIVESEPNGRGARPSGVGDEEWRVLLDASLRRSGLFTARGADLVFVHHTLMEYLAAEHDLREDGVEALERVFRRRHKRGVDLAKVFRDPAELELWEEAHLSTAGVPVLRIRKYWRIPLEDPSYVGLLIDAAQERGIRSSRYIRRLARCGGTAGLEFVIGLAEMQTALPDDARRTMADVLHRNARFGDERCQAAIKLARLGDDRAGDLLYGVAVDATLPKRIRVASAAVLRQVDDPRAAELLRTFVQQNTGHDRMEALTELALLGEPGATDELHDAARDTTVPAFSREYAAFTLARVADPPAADLLHDLAHDPTLPDDYRRRAAERLGELGDPRSADLLHELIRDTTLDANTRTRAATALTRMGDLRGTHGMHDLARDTTLEGTDRRRAGEALARLGDPRAADVLYDLARDTALSGFDRRVAAQALFDLDQPRSVDVLHDLARDAAFTGADREIAAHTLINVGDPRAADVLYTFACDVTADGWYRRQAAEALGLLDDPRAGDALYDLTRDTALSDFDRRVAAQALRTLGDPRSAEPSE